MASRSVFSLRVARCPACHARLPVRGNEKIVVCEYCDARVELQRQAPEPRPPSSPRRHVARSSYSGFAVAMVLVVLTIGIATATAVVSGVASDILDSVQSWTPPPSPNLPTVSERGPAGGSQLQVPTRPSAPASSGGSTAKAPSSETIEPETPSAEPAKPKPSSGKSSPAPSGPVLSVAEAKAKLEPKVLACMRTTEIHALRAYMGNSTVGPVHVLSDSRTRVDGKRTKLSGTALGRCMNEAGAAVRTRAFESNYVRLELRNDAVPDPLASLPAKADRKAIATTVATHDAEVKACAAKHGQEGSREVFYFTIDGPTGKVISVRGSYGSQGFRRCAEAIYRALLFDRVQEYEVKHTHSMQL